MKILLKKTVIARVQYAQHKTYLRQVKKLTDFLRSSSSSSSLLSLFYSWFSFSENTIKCQ